MKKLIKFLFNKIGIVILSSDNEILRKPILPGPFDVQQGFFLANKELVIFDVGAQYGQTAFEYSKRFNNSKIYSFEPFKESFNILMDNIREITDIQIFNFGFGDSIGTKKFNCNSFSATNSILETHEEGISTWGTNLLETIETIDINVTTIDDFVEQQEINEIDILKIDVQGYEFNVIQGAHRLILKNGVKVIYLEIIIQPTYKNQKHLDEVLNLLRSYDFSLYNVYNLSYDSFGSLRQLDAIFISDAYKSKLFL